MSSEYSVLVDGTPHHAKLALEDLTGLSLSPALHGEPGVFHADFLGVAITLCGNHGLDDDAGTNFSEYPVSIEFSRSAASGHADLLEKLCQTLAIITGRLIARKGIGKNIVVRNGQEIVEINDLQT